MIPFAAYDVLRLRAAQSTTRTTSSGAARSVPPHPLTLQPQPAVQVTCRGGAGKINAQIAGLMDACPRDGPPAACPHTHTHTRRRRARTLFSALGPVGLHGQASRVRQVRPYPHDVVGPAGLIPRVRPALSSPRLFLPSRRARSPRQAILHPALP